MTEPGAAAAHRVAAALNTVSTAAGRSYFLAGFAYYEIGRFGFAPNQDRGYLALMTLTFVFAVAASVLSTMVTFYTARMRGPSDRAFFIDQVNGWHVRGTFRLFLLALLCYTAGLSRIGYVRYDHTSYKFVPQVIFAVIGVVLAVGIIRIVQIARQLAAGPTVTNTTESDENTGDSGSSVTADFLLKQSTTIAGRAVYLAGFMQAGVTRYLPTDLDAGHAFLVVMTLACGLAIIPAFLLTTINIFVVDTAGATARNLAAKKYLPLAQLCFLAYVGSFGLLMLAIALMGYGCRFGSDAAIPLTMGLLGFFALVGGVVWVHTTLKTVRASEPEREPSKRDIFDVERVLTLINRTGSLATISSGFVFYNVVTYATDILSLPTPRPWQQFFLVVNVVTVVSGVISAIYDSLVSLWLNDLPSVAQQAVFARLISPMVAVCVQAFRVSLVAFMVGFAIFGRVKYTPEKYEPAWVGVLGIVVMAAGSVFISLVGRSETMQPGSATRTADDALRERLVPETNADADADADYEISADDPDTLTAAAAAAPPSSATQLASQLDILANRSLFFGGFGYFAVSFLFTNRPVANTYLISMGLSYVSAITLVVWATFVSVQLAACESSAGKEHLALRLRPKLYPLAIGMGVFSLAAFFIAFMQMGFVKPITDYAKYALVELVGGLLGLVGCIVVIVQVTQKYKRVLVPAAVIEPQESEENFDFQRMVDQVNATATQCAFVAGNVFYEILFAIAGPYWYANGFYFVSATITMASGAMVVAAASAMSLWLAQLTEPSQRTQFGRAIKGTKTLVFYLANICQYAWMSSIVVMGAAKYPHEWRTSFVVGLFGVALITAASTHIKATSNRLLK